MKINVNNCEQARQTMDFFLTRTAIELDRNELERHLMFCVECAVEFAERQRIKRLVKRAVQRSEAAPVGLRWSIKNLIRSEV